MYRIYVFWSIDNQWFNKNQQFWSKKEVLKSLRRNMTLNVIAEILLTDLLSF